MLRFLLVTMLALSCNRNKSAEEAAADSKNLESTFQNPTENREGNSGKGETRPTIVIDGTVKLVEAYKCPPSALGAAITFEDGATVPAVGMKTKVLLKILVGSGSDLIVPTLTTETSEVVAVSANSIEFLKVGMARLTAVACGMSVPFEVKVFQSQSLTPQCQEMTRSILEYSRLHPNCMQKDQVTAPNCRAEQTAFDQSLALLVQCNASCEAKQSVVEAAQAALQNCQSQFASAGEPCGADYADIVLRCPVVLATACKNPEIATLCGGLLP